MNSIKRVEEWVFDQHPDISEDVSEQNLGDIQEVLAHAKKSDKYIRQMYEVVGFMFKDASKAMSQGKAEKYMDLTVDEMFERVHEIMELPRPLDMAPALDDIPDAANDLPSIILAPGDNVNFKV